MRRRNFITLLGGAAATPSIWPLAARAQQPGLPVVGLLVSESAQSFAGSLASVRQGLGAEGYVEGRNVAIEYRYANLQYDRLPALAADLVQRRVAVIFASGSVRPALAAKAATTTIPIVFLNGSDPVKLGLVASLSRPGGNATGMSLFGTETTTKRLGLLHEMVPKAATIAMLVNPSNPNAESNIAEVRTAARVIGVQILVINAASESEFDAAFAKIVEQRADALLVGIDPLFIDERVGKLIALAARHSVPAIFSDSRPIGTYRGQLMSYTYTDDMFRQAGVHIGRILKGEKPADLPVLQPTKFRLIINLNTARALGVTVPPSLLAIADEVIE